MRIIICKQNDNQKQKSELQKIAAEKRTNGHAAIVKYYLEMGKDAAINSRPEDSKLQIYICDRKTGK